MTEPTTPETDELTLARQWAAWFAAERDYHLAEREKEWARIAGKQRRDEARIIELGTRLGKYETVEL
jgi:hypothetical protein